MEILKLVNENFRYIIIIKMKISHLEKCENILVHFMRDPNAKLLVKSEQYEPSYNSLYISSQPLDINIIKYRIQNNLYDSIDQFADDFQQLLSTQNINKFYDKPAYGSRKLLKKFHMLMKKSVSSSKKCNCIYLFY